jgi:hypothetical protein
MLAAAVNPYHLTTRESALMAAALLFDRLHTLVPGPLSGLDEATVRGAIKSHPPLLRVLESWRWSADLWEAGVLCSGLEGDDALDDVQQSCEAIGVRPDCAGPGGFGRFLHAKVFAMEGEYLQGVCTDVLKGGADPGISVPMLAGLDRFAIRHRLLAVRAGGPSENQQRLSAGRSGPSLAQRAEGLIGTTLCTFALPVLTVAGSDAILQARDLLAEPLQGLRRVMSAMTGAGGTSGIAGPSQADIREAAAAVTRRFSTVRAELVGQDDNAGRRIIEGQVKISLRRLPADAAVLAVGDGQCGIRCSGRGGFTPAVRRGGHAHAGLRTVDPADWFTSTRPRAPPCPAPPAQHDLIHAICPGRAATRAQRRRRCWSAMAPGCGRWRCGCAATRRMPTTRCRTRSCRRFASGTPSRARRTRGLGCTRSRCGRARRGGGEVAEAARAAAASGCRRCRS